MNKKLDMEEMNAKETKQKRNPVILNHVLFIASGQAGLDGLIVPKTVAQEYQQEPGSLIKKLDMEVINAKERKQKRNPVTLNHVLFIANGQAGLDGQTVLKPVVMDLKQEQEEKPKLRCMKEKIAKATTQKLRNVTSRNVLSIANGQPGTIGALVPKVVEMELGKEAEKF